MTHDFTVSSLETNDEVGLKVVKLSIGYADYPLVPLTECSFTVDVLFNSSATANPITTIEEPPTFSFGEITQPPDIYCDTGDHIYAFPEVIQDSESEQTEYYTLGLVA